MAELVVTETSVVVTDGSIQQGTLGGTVTAGMSVYKNASDVWLAAQADGTALEAGSSGIAIAVSGGASGQRFLYVDKSGVTITIGAAVAAGVFYYVGPTAGGIGLSSDLGSTNRVTQLAYGISTTQIITNFKYTDEVLA